MDKKCLLFVSAEIDSIEYYYRVFRVDKCHGIVSEDFTCLFESILTKSRRVIVSSTDKLPFSCTLSLMEEYLVMCAIHNNWSSGDSELRTCSSEVEGRDAEECSHTRKLRIYFNSILSYAFFKYFTMYSSSSVYPRFS